MQVCSLCASGTILIKSLGEGAPMCVWQGGEKRALCAEVWEWAQLASIVKPGHAGVLEASHGCILHHQMAGRGASILPSQAQIGSPILPHQDHLSSTTCRIKLSNNIGKGMGFIRSQAATGCARNSSKLALASIDVLYYTLLA
eukprot:1159753-Pelagomonas_calceolata.AAC.7